MKSIEELKKELARIDTELADVESRMPAHSVKPPIMQALFALEEAREVIVVKLKALGETVL
ncbi:MAG: histidine kinase [Pseudomonadota bacterium]